MFTLMNKVLLLGVLAATALAFAGCETTGDPNSGGIFWSPAKAQDRLDERQDRLNDLNSDTDQVQQQNHHLQNQMNQGQ
jgi:hypothetical protein